MLQERNHSSSHIDSTYILVPPKCIYSIVVKATPSKGIARGTVEEEETCLYGQECRVGAQVYLHD